MDCDDDDDDEEDDTNNILDYENKQTHPTFKNEETRIPPSPSVPPSSLIVHQPTLVAPTSITSKSSTPSPLSPPSLHSTSHSMNNNNICYSIFSDMLFSSNSLSSDDQLMDRQSSLGSLCGPSLCT